MTMTDDHSPRIPPLPRDAWTDAARDVFALMGGPAARENGLSNNAIETLARHPELATAFLTFDLHLLAKSTLPPRLRELVILRTCWVNCFEYDWRYHQRTGAQLGITADEVRALQEGPEADCWTALERAALRAIDQMRQGGRIDDATWGALAAELSPAQLMDLLFTVGGYVMIAMAMSNMGVELEPGMPRGMGVTGT
jgi:alkylhydroperoxidase family enzyme